MFPSVNFNKTIKKTTNQSAVFSSYANLHDFRLKYLAINILFYFESEQVQELRKGCFPFKFRLIKRIINSDSAIEARFSVTHSYEFNVFSNVLTNVKEYDRNCFYPRVKLTIQMWANFQVWRAIQSLAAKSWYYYICCHPGFFRGKTLSYRSSLSLFRNFSDKLRTNVHKCVIGKMRLRGSVHCSIHLSSTGLI